MELKSNFLQQPENGFKVVNLRCLFRQMVAILVSLFFHFPLFMAQIFTWKCGFSQSILSDRHVSELNINEAQLKNK